MAVATVSSLDAALKNVYLPRLVKNINTKTALYSFLRKKGADEVQYTGRQFVVPMVTGYPEGIGSRTGSSAVLPSADGVAVNQATYTASKLFNRIQIDWDAIEVTESKAGSPERALALNMRAAEANMVHEINRIIMGKGDGVLTNCGVSVTGTTVTVTSTKNLRAGMRIDIRDRITGTAVAGGGDSNTISSITNSTSFVVGTALTAATAATDAVYREDSRNMDPAGVDFICDDTDDENGLSDLGGLDRDTYTFWKAQKVHNSGTDRELALSHLQEGLDLVDINSTGMPKVMVTGHAVERKYGRLLQPDIRYGRDEDGKVGKLGAGYTGLTYNNLPLLKEKHAAAGVIYILDTDYLYVAHTKDPHFFDKDGNVLRAQAGSGATAVVEATLWYMWAIVAEACSVHCRIEDILES